MAKRRMLNGIAADLLGSFVSRNNDVGGYWAIGRLNSLAAGGARPIEIDLLRERGSDSDDVAVVSRLYHRWLEAHLAKHGIPREWLVSAVVRLDFGTHEGQPPPQTTWGEPFVCRVSLTDNLGRVYARSHSGRSAPHDPARERRSARAAGP